MQSENEFEDKMVKSMKDKIQENKKLHQVDFKEGLYYFADNLKRLGIESKRDLEQSSKKSHFINNVQCISCFFY